MIDKVHISFAFALLVGAVLARLTTRRMVFTHERFHRYYTYTLRALPLFSHHTQPAMLVICCACLDGGLLRSHLEPDKQYVSTYVFRIFLKVSLFIRWFSLVRSSRLQSRHTRGALRRGDADCVRMLFHIHTHIHTYIHKLIEFGLRVRSRDRFATQSQSFACPCLCSSGWREDRECVDGFYLICCLIYM